MNTAQIEPVALATLAPNPRNPKRHANALIEESMTRFGMVEPVIVDQRTGFLISGHGRVETLRSMFDANEPAPEWITTDADGGWLVPAVTSWSSANDFEADAAIVSLNRTTEIGGWETQPLADILSGLLTEENGLAGVGYGADDLDVLLRALDANDKFTMDFTDVIDEFLDVTNTGAESFTKQAFRVLRVVFPNEDGARLFYDTLNVAYDETARSLAYPFANRTPAEVFNG